MLSPPSRSERRSFHSTKGIYVRKARVVIQQMTDRRGVFFSLHVTPPLTSLLEGLWHAIPRVGASKNKRALIGSFKGKIPSKREDPLPRGWRATTEWRRDVPRKENATSIRRSSRVTIPLFSRRYYPGQAPAGTGAWSLEHARACSLTCVARVCHSR